MSKRIVYPETTILIPYIKGMLHPGTEHWAKIYTNTELVELDAGDDTAYWRLLAMAWRESGDLVIVEQDIVPPLDGIESMARCPRRWCTCVYEIAHGTWLDSGLGCVKFSARAKHHYPALMDRVGYIDNDGSPAKDWHRLDTRVSLVMHQLDYLPHSRGHGKAQHMHDYSK